MALRTRHERKARATTLAWLAVTGALAGCLSGDAPPGSGSVIGDAPELAPDGAPADDSAPTVVWALALEDGRSDPLAPLRVVLRGTGSGAAIESPVEVVWDMEGRIARDFVAVDEDGSLNVTRAFDVGPGEHVIAAAVSNARVEGVFTAWAPVILALNASEEYASDQNVFHSVHRVAFAPWRAESALDVLHRAADLHGFPVVATYREDLDSWFVDAINGTEFRWEEPEILGYSRNWMILHEGGQTNTAADDTYPQPGDVVEYRYVRCDSAGRCEGIDE